MRTLFATLVVSALSVGCAVNAERGDDESDVGEAEGALSAYGKNLVGTFTTTDMASDFDKIVLNADGTYVTSETIFCIKAPCEPIRDEGRFIGYKPSKSGYLGGLRLTSKKTGNSVYYRVSLGEANRSFKLSRDGKIFFAYSAVSTEPKACVRQGCSGSICTELDKPVVTTCEWRDEYACYATAICERGVDGACGWRETVELTNCLEGAR